MMKHEFEELAKRTVTIEQYEAIEALYMASDLSKSEFVKSIKGLLKSIPEQPSRTVLTMAQHNMYGGMTTPNGACYMTIQVELINVDIKTGKKMVKVIPNTFEFKSYYDITDWDYGLEIIK